MSLQDFDQLWDYSNPAATEDKFRKLLAEATDKDREYTICLQTQIARTLGLQQRFEEANALLDLIDAAQISGRAQVKATLERGRVKRSSGDKAGASPFFQRALQLAQEHQLDYFAIDALHMLGIIEPDEDWNQRAILLAETSPEPTAKKWLGSLYNNVGWNLHDKSKFDEALSLFQKAVAFREQSNQPKELHVARWSVARTLRSLGRYQDALSLQQELAEALRTRGDADGFVSEEIGECLLAQGLDAEAKPHFGEAHRLLSKESWIEPERLQRLQNLAQ